MAAELVVDSSVVIKWFVTEALVTEAVAILHAYQAGTVTLLAPDLIYAELGNIIWKKQLQQSLPPWMPHRSSVRSWPCR